MPDVKVEYLVGPNASYEYHLDAVASVRLSGALAIVANASGRIVKIYNRDSWSTVEEV